MQLENIALIRKEAAKAAKVTYKAVELFQSKFDDTKKSWNTQLFKRIKKEEIPVGLAIADWKSADRQFLVEIADTPEESKIIGEIVSDKRAERYEKLQAELTKKADKANKKA